MSFIPLKRTHIQVSEYLVWHFIVELIFMIARFGARLNRQFSLFIAAT